MERKHGDGGNAVSAQRVNLYHKRGRRECVRSGMQIGQEDDEKDGGYFAEGQKRGDRLVERWGEHHQQSDIREGRREPRSLVHI